jgi:hypothetical protein
VISPVPPIQLLCSTGLQQILGHGVEKVEQGLHLKLSEMVWRDAIVEKVWERGERRREEWEQREGSRDRVSASNRSIMSHITAACGPMPNVTGQYTQLMS